MAVRRRYPEPQTPSLLPIAFPRCRSALLDATYSPPVCKLLLVCRFFLLTLLLFSSSTLALPQLCALGIVGAAATANAIRPYESRLFVGGKVFSLTSTPQPPPSLDPFIPDETCKLAALYCFCSGRKPTQSLHQSFETFDDVALLEGRLISTSPLTALHLTFIRICSASPAFPSPCHTCRLSSWSGMALLQRCAPLSLSDTYVLV